MKWIGFLLFLTASLFYIWNGKDDFNKKEWLFFALKPVLILVVTFAVVVILKFILSVWPFAPVSTVKAVLVSITGSFLCLWGTKFLVVMLCTLFGKIIGFHLGYNKGNYQSLSSLAGELGSTLLMLAKYVVSFGSALMLYGVWLS
ncbi:hypothetical protein [Erwinia piriflorinigrans]|uniref:hypothetical protein n=1 Tax=Erwinia piriflorinigrans TaxID=665097 RepID=UPI00066133CB|nr:hypothetical protein [Erwinia piriflorinigrans]